MAQEMNEQMHSMEEADAIAADLDFPEVLDDTDTAYDGKVRTRAKWAYEVFDFFETLIIAACAILFLFTFVARISTVEGDSMRNTLEDGDRLVVSNLFYKPSQGDIVVFQNLDTNYKSAIVKRIIAVGGQTVKLTYSADSGMNRVTVEVDGVVLQEDYRFYDAAIGHAYQYRYTGTYEYEVPEGHVFVMGDNTYNSEDSRGEFGYVKEEQILGRVVVRVWCKDLSKLAEKFGTVN